MNIINGVSLGNTKSNGDTKQIQNLIDNCCKKLIRNGSLPKHLEEDAKQEGWVAYLEGKEIMSYLTKWARKEKVEKAVIADLREINKPSKKVKSKINIDKLKYENIRDSGYKCLDTEPSTDS